MTETITVPRVKIKTGVVESPVSKCGDNWWMDVRVRAPYKGTDVAHRTLPSLGDPGQIESYDPVFLDEIAADHGRVAAFVINNRESLGERQYDNFQTMMDRAMSYIADAKTICDAWATGFETSSLGKIPQWPLGGQPQGSVNANIEEGHARDCKVWKKLVRAALKNIRCAEEIAKKATIRSRNKNRSRVYGVAGLAPEGGGGGGPSEPVHQLPVLKLSADWSAPKEEEEEPEVESEPIQSVSVEVEVDEELEEGDINLEEDVDADLDPGTPQTFEELEAGKKTKTKKGNTALIAGAAALGLLIFSKR
jgi:hypothetical protein